MNPHTHPLSRQTFWQLAGLWLVIVAAKLALIVEFSSPLPFLDQWVGEGAEVFRPWLHGEMSAAQFFTPFNQHRMVPSRLLALGLFEANARQWDAQVQMLAGAALHAGAAALLGALLIARLGAARKWPIFGALLVVFALPFDWQNTLWGFQSLFYFAILFTVPAIVGLLSCAPLSRGWWLAVASGVAACFSIGSGGLAGCAVAGWIMLRLAAAPRLRTQRREWLSLAAGLALGAVMLTLYTPATSENIAGRTAPSVASFLSRLSLHLSWPQVASPLLALVAFAPVVILGVVHLRRLRREDLPSSAPEDFIVPLALWVVLQSAALSASRHTGMATVVSRYMDILALGALANFAALLRLASVLNAPRTRFSAVRLAAAAWAIFMIAGLVPIVQRNVTLDLPNLRQMHRVQVGAVRQFLATSDAETLGGKRIFGLPGPEFEVFVALLRDPAIQEILPTGIGVRRTLAAAGPLSVTVQLLATGWQIMLAAGLLVIALATFRRPRTTGVPHSVAVPTEICRTAS